MTKFIVSHQDQQLGPFDEQEIKAQWTAGSLLGIDYVYDEAKQDWVLLAERFPWAAAGQLDDTMPVQIQLIEGPNPHPVRGDDESTNIIISRPHQAAEVEFTEGLGEASLAPFGPGHVTLKINHAELGPQEFDIEVIPAEPVRVRWNLPVNRVVGDELELVFDVVDANDLPCLGYEGEFTVIVGGDAEKRHVVKTFDGTGRVRFTETKSQNWMVHLEYRGADSLVLPAKTKLEWLAGPAARFVLDNSTEFKAGMPLKVQVKALDRFGNVARDFKGKVVFDVKAS